MTDLQEVTLETVAGGSAPERFQREWQRILENIQDPNTDPEAPREFSLTVKVKPSGDRDSAAIALVTKSKLAPPAAVKDLIYMGRREGRLVAIGRDPRQRHLNFDGGEDEDSVLPIDRRKDSANAG